MKKTSFIALLITAAMMTTSTLSAPAYAQQTAAPSSSVGNTTSEWENKLGDPIYVEFLNNADENEKLMTIVGITDMADHEAIEKEAQRITGINEENYDTISESEYSEELAKWSSEDEELLKNASNPEDMKKSIIDGRVRENKANRFARIVNQLTADVYTEENAKILAKLGVAEEDVVDIGTDLPTLILMLTKSEIERIAEFDDVKCIDLDIFHDVPQVEGDQREYNKKIDPDELVPMLEKAEEGDKLTVWVWVVDKAKDEAICAEVRSRMIADGSWENHTNPEYDNWDDTSKMISDSRRLQDEVYKQENPKIAAALELAEEDIIEIGTREPIFTLKLTSSEIERIAESEYVTHIDYIDLNAVAEVQETNVDTDIPALDLNVPDGEGVAWYPGKGGTVSFTVESTADRFLSIDLNGKKAEPENYTVAQTEDGALVTFDPEYLQTLPEGVYEAIAYFTNGLAHYRITVNGAALIELCGDLDNDGVITANDALMILRVSISLDTLEAAYNTLADADGDGIVDSNDALIILRRSVGFAC